MYIYILGAGGGVQIFLGEGPQKLVKGVKNIFWEGSYLYFYFLFWAGYNNLLGAEGGGAQLASSTA